MDIANIIQTIAIYALPVLFAITLHEAAHGYVARYFGDDTAWVLGRVTLNPLKHIDPFGTILMPAMMYLATFAVPGGPFILGYAKPVPVHFGNLRNPKRDMIWVALAGPGINFVQAVFWAVMFVVLSSTDTADNFFVQMAKAGIVVNLALAVLNLFPLPPLDGGRVLVGLLPWKYGQQLARIEPYGFFIVLGLIVFKVFGPLWMEPMMALSYRLLSIFIAPVAMLLR
jgi:Zn-dependent protease